MQHLLMSNYSDLHNQMLTSYQSFNANEQVPVAQDPERNAVPAFLENRNLQQVVTLTENEMRVLCQLPPNQTGVLVTLLLAYALTCTVAMFETALMPLLAEADLLDNKIDTHFGYPLLSCISVTATVSYFVFRRFTMQNSRQLPQLSDRSFVFVSLLLAIAGSSL